MQESVKLPEPPGYPFIGNLAEFVSSPMKDLSRLADTYGEAFRLRIGSKPSVMVTSHRLVHEICDEKRFRKSIRTSLGEVRHGVADGLFTALDDEPNWGKAHRVLIPAFGPLPIRGMYDDMYDISTQLCMKWARHGGQARIRITEDFTRLALDTIALCAMDYRFNSFYSEQLHPFIRSMGDFLTECTSRRQRPSFAPEFLYRKQNEKFAADIAIMRDTADAVVKARRENPSDRKDLLSAMLNGVDPQTGEKLSQDNITSQLITFLIAGHETTSGMMSFAFVMLLKHPAAYQKVQEEVDAVCGRSTVKVEHVNKLIYLAAVLRETLRVCAPIPAFTVEPLEDTLLDGKWLLHKGEPVTALLIKSHKDPAVFGDDAEDFKPERMLDDGFANLSKEFPDFWKPFGNGKRACIGRPFAWQEAMLCMAMLFQNFNFTMADPGYQLDFVETMTIKPKDFYMHATLRHGMSATELEHTLAARGAPPASESHRDSHQSNKEAEDAGVTGHGKPLAIYYGSNSGTCEALAQRIAADAASHGFRPTVVSPLDAAKEKLPKDQPVVIVTASYEGQPPSNAALFVAWLESLKGSSEMEGIHYAVFGCGHSDWVQTFHRIPKLVDSKLAELGAKRLVLMTGTNAAEGDMFSDFESWEDEKLWPALLEKYGGGGGDDESAQANSSPDVTVEVSNPRTATLRQDVEEAMVLAERTLTSEAALSAKKHIEIQLPTGMSYKVGDYLAVLPFNPKETVARVFRRFELSWDASLKITATRPVSLPTDSVVSARDVIGAYVELTQPATKKNILTLAQATNDQAVGDELTRMAGEAYQGEVLSKRVSVLDILERHPNIALSLGSFLAMLPPMRVRQYSISSSPLVNPQTATLTYSVLNQPSLASPSTPYQGVASTFLSTLGPGEKLHVSVRPSASSFRLPPDPANTPLICIAAGSGLAPFRGFFQERAAMIAAGRAVAPALFFFGCRSPEDDDLYQTEFAEWEVAGAVAVRRAYSRATHLSEGCRYVRDRMLHDRAELVRLWKGGARIYVCGSKQVGTSVEQVVLQIAKEEAEKEQGAPEDRASDGKVKAWWEGCKSERFATDVFD